MKANFKQFQATPRNVMQAASTDDARPVLCAVLFEMTGDTLKITAADVYHANAAQVTAEFARLSVSVK